MDSIGPITRETHIDADLERCLTERTGTLTVLSGGTVGAVFVLTAASTVIGRSDQAQIPIDHDSVSRLHACLYRDGTLYEIEDLGSTNGTYVGGDRISGRVRLWDGVRVRIAGCLFRFGMQDRLEAEAARQIFEMGVRDGLTGMHNRRFFDERMRNEFAFANRHGTPLCVIACDIDHFKRVNDTLGHQAGDAVLKHIAQLLQDAVRTEDVVARCGGEEFAVIARGIEIGGAIAFAERIRKLVEGARFMWQGARVPVTVSIGIAHNRAGPRFADQAALLAAADAAMYEAKRLGRNRTKLAGSPGRYTGVEPAAAAPLLEPTPRAVVRKRRADDVTAPAQPGQAQRGPNDRRR
jgi:two-component system, cell cycle response regulator